ncbi:8f130bd3-c285-4eb8-adf4-5f175b419792 [Thermothielavioides terrestris]|uniref:8f130bd3-c285-4eb8-adf4-5f175b419792 n=1 Tax=Thermothielavioides terrestris TaxID=2587410 RepID=A0A3S4C7Q3_9PEZI|nr:8f130bd3-c285-4eb8-adf4-5f175b419792 [Thermothielavioides terrestris]
MTDLTFTTLSVRRHHVWDDSPSLASRVVFEDHPDRTSWATPRHYAHARPKRLSKSECRQLFRSTSSLPSIHVHGPSCRCGQVQTEDQLQDELLAHKISSLSKALLTTFGTTGSNPPHHHHRKPSSSSNPHRRSRSRSAAGSLLSTLTRLFSPPQPPPSLPFQADLCIACANLDIDKVARYLLIPSHNHSDSSDNRSPNPPAPLPVNQPNPAGLTPLMALVRSPAARARPRAHLAMVRFLVECCGADADAARVDRATGRGESVLSMACAAGLAGVVRFLVVERGVDADRRLPAGSGRGGAGGGAGTGAGGAGEDKGRGRGGGVEVGGAGQTALHVAVLADRPECVEVLVKEGRADVDAVFDGAGLVWNQGGRAKNRSAASRGGASKGPRHPVSALHLAHASYACTKVLLEGGARVDVRDGYGRTPLHWAAESGNADVVRLLVEAGADLTAAGHNGSTPLEVVLGESDGEDENKDSGQIACVSA